jgi:hypothetical protein
VNLAVRAMTPVEARRRHPGRLAAMRGIVFPGVFRPRSDTWLLAAAARGEAVPPGGRILELWGPATPA